MNAPNGLDRQQEWRCNDILFCLAQVPDSRRLLFGSSDFNIYEWNVDEDKPERRKFKGDGHTSYVTALTIANNHAISGSYDGSLIWWDLQSKEQKKQVAAHDKWIRRVISTPDKRLIVSIADDMKCKLWDAESGELKATLTGHSETTPHHYPSMLYAVCCSSNGDWLATGDKTGHVVIWDLNTYQQVQTVQAPIMYTWDPKQRRHSIGGIRSLAFSPDSNRLAVGGIGKIGNIDHLGGPARLEIFDWRSGERLQEVEDDKRKGLIEQILWSSEDWLLTAGGDHKGFLTAYDTNSAEMLFQAGNAGHIHAVCWDETTSDFFVAAHQRLEHWLAKGEVKN